METERARALLRALDGCLALARHGGHSTQVVERRVPPVLKPELLDPPDDVPAF